MPPKTKKEHKRNPQERSGWHNIHFSGKLILCSVIFGLMLVLVGGIVMAIGADNDDESKSNDYGDVSKKPPMPIVGSVIMGIGGFTVILGVVMCLVETKVCRRRTTDTNPLIAGEGIESTLTGSGGAPNSSPTAVPSTSRQHHHRHGKKSPSPRKQKVHSKKPQSTKDKTPEVPVPRSQPSTPIGVNAESSNHFLTLSDKFLTPTNSFAQEVVKSSSQDAEIQTSSSLMKSFTSSGMSWNASNEFQTPDTSFNGNSMSLEISQKSRDAPKSLSPTNPLVTRNEKIPGHEFVTPKNSDAEKIASSTVAITENDLEKSQIRTATDFANRTGSHLPKPSELKPTHSVKSSFVDGYPKDSKTLNNMDSKSPIDSIVPREDKDSLVDDIKNNIDPNSQNLNSNFDDASSVQAAVSHLEDGISIDVSSDIVFETNTLKIQSNGSDGGLKKVSLIDVKKPNLDRKDNKYSESSSDESSNLNQSIPAILDDLLFMEIAEEIAIDYASHHKKEEHQSVVNADLISCEASEESNKQDDSTFISTEINLTNEFEGTNVEEQVNIMNSDSLYQNSPSIEYQTEEPDFSHHHDYSVYCDNDEILSDTVCDLDDY